MTTATKTMLALSPVHAVLPAVDLKRATSFYSDVLGLEVEPIDSANAIVHAGSGTSILIYERAPSTAEHTVAEFTVSDLRSTVSELRSHGVVFEEYDLPGIHTVDGIAESDGYSAAWFRDSERNIIAISQMK